jgi:hypothetical protein
MESDMDIDDKEDDNVGKGNVSKKKTKKKTAIKRKQSGGDDDEDDNVVKKAKVVKKKAPAKKKDDDDVSENEDEEKADSSPAAKKKAAAAAKKAAAAAAKPASLDISPVAYAPGALVKDEIVSTTRYMWVDSSAAGTFMSTDLRADGKCWKTTTDSYQCMSSSKYSKTVLLGKTELAKFFANCTTGVITVTFTKVLPDKPAEWKAFMEENDVNAVRKDEDVDWGAFFKEACKGKQRTMTCRMLEPNTILGYSLVDEFLATDKDRPKPAAGERVKANCKNVNHREINKFIYNDTLYELK